MTSIALKYNIENNHYLVIAGCDDGSIKVLDIFTQNLVWSFKPVDLAQQPRNNPVKQVILSTDGEYVFAGFKDGSVQMQSLSNPNERKILRGKGC